MVMVMELMPDEGKNGDGTQVNVNYARRTHRASVDLTVPGQNRPERRPKHINILHESGPSRYSNTGVRRYQEYDPAPCQRAHQATVTFPINTLAFRMKGRG